MIAVLMHADVVLAGIAIPPHRMLEVVDELDPDDDCAEGRRVLRVGEARALVQAGHAEPIEADFDELPDLIDGWQRA